MFFPKLEIISDEYSVAACDKEGIPQCIESIMPLEKVTVLYWHDRDWLVLNKDNPCYERYKDMLTGYLEMSDRQRKELNDYAHIRNVTFFDFINKALRIRRQRYKKMSRKSA